MAHYAYREISVVHHENFFDIERRVVHCEYKSTCSLPTTQETENQFNVSNAKNQRISSLSQLAYQTSVVHQETVAQKGIAVVSGRQRKL
jgi:hypothetical protein